MYKQCIVLMGVISLTACSLAKIDTPEDQRQLVRPEAVPQQADDLPWVGPERPKVELTEALLRRFLMAEFAGHAGLFEVSIKHYLSLAATTQDHKVAERATHVAMYAQDMKAAKQAALLWAELDPHHPDPYKILAMVAIRNNQLDLALRHLETIMQATQGDTAQKLWAIMTFLNHEEDKGVVNQITQRLMARYREDTDIMHTVAQMGIRLGNIALSLDMLQGILALEPDNEQVGLDYIVLLQRAGKPDQAMAWLKDRLDKKDSFILRQAYARLLAGQQYFNEAHQQFSRLFEQDPDHVDVQYSLGLLALQKNLFKEAGYYFQRLNDNHKKTDQTSFFLGFIAEQENQLEQAKSWYEKVQGGEHYVNARIHLGLLLAKQGRLDDALQHIRNTRVQEYQYELALIQAEVRLLTEAKRYIEAMTLLNTALEKNTHPDLLYSRAMLAEKMERLDILERDLRAVLRENPDNFVALNALGYTLTEKTDRYQEAYELIKRALELQPNDVSILDSMGWILYHLGDLAGARHYLNEALKLRQDPEIAAHLGEVLWVMGDRQAAKGIWDSALEYAPEDAYLLEVIQRFGP